MITAYQGKKITVMGLGRFGGGVGVRVPAMGMIVLAMGMIVLAMVMAMIVRGRGLVLMGALALMGVAVIFLLRTRSAGGEEKGESGKAGKRSGGH